MNTARLTLVYQSDIVVDMILSNNGVHDAMKEGNLVIDPFRPKNLGTSSYDVTLGRYYYRESTSHQCTFYNPWNKDETNRVWKSLHEAQPAKKIFSAHDLKRYGIKPSQEVILIHPGETILAHTEEFIGGSGNLTTMMKARSSIGRNFLEVCKCAGWGDVGYINRWAMEITNNSQSYTIPLFIGARIAQIIFLETTEVTGNYAHEGKYQTDTAIENIKKKWKPQDILPRLYNDREFKK